MSYEMTGTLQKIGDVQTFDSGFQKKQIVINTGGEYPQEIPMDLVKDKVSLTDKLTEGQEVELKFDLRGNAWKEKFYLNAVCYFIKAVANANAKPAPKSDEPEGDTPF
jgi:single-strand DNA-binding protein